MNRLIDENIKGEWVRIVDDIKITILTYCLQNIIFVRVVELSKTIDILIRLIILVQGEFDLMSLVQI